MRAFSLGSAQDTCRRLLRGRSVSRADEVQQQQQQQAGTPSTSFKIKTWNGTATEWNHGREGRRETSTADAYGLQRVLAAHSCSTATAWFDKWKAYVNYDDDEETVEGCHPGPVRNRSLKGSFPEELRRDLVAERDYILLPHAAAEMLLTKYGGGPKFPRRVRTSPVDQSLEVDLWLVRTILYLCDRSQPTPVSRRGPKHHRFLFHCGWTLQNIVNFAVQSHFHIDVTITPIRWWLLETPPQPNVTATGMGRRLTNEFVDWDGDWHVLRSGMSRRLKDIRGDGDHIELIIEVAPCPNPKTSDWPRSHLLEAWKSGIHKDDMLDARDTQGHFRAARVMSADGEETLLVRYWNGEFDWILASDFDRRIAPLHSHSSATSGTTAATTAPGVLVTNTRPLEGPPAASNASGGGGAEDRGAGQVAKVARSGPSEELSLPPGRTGGSSGNAAAGSSGTETPPLKVSEKVPMQVADVELGTHLRRALQAQGITTPRVEALLQVLRKAEVTTLAVWQAMSPSELNGLLETHRKTLTVGLRAALRLIHGATSPPKEQKP